MHLFKTEMLFLPSSARASSTQAVRLRYGGRGPRLQRLLDDRPARSASICVLDPADRHCACRGDRSAAWLPNCDLERAA